LDKQCQTRSEASNNAIAVAKRDKNHHSPPSNCSPPLTAIFFHPSRRAPDKHFFVIMPKAKSSTKASKENAPKTEKAAKQADAEKPKRPPSLYQQFMKRELKHYKERHPEVSPKEAFSAVRPSA
jgi:hypothetical protein